MCLRLPSYRGAHRGRERSGHLPWVTQPLNSMRDSTLLSLPPEPAPERDLPSGRPDLGGGRQLESLQTGVGDPAVERGGLPSRELTGQEEELEYPGFAPFCYHATWAQTSADVVQGRETTGVVKRIAKWRPA